MQKIKVTLDELNRIVYPLQERAHALGMSTTERVNLFFNIEIVERKNKFVSELAELFRRYGVNFVFGKPDEDQPKVMIEGPKVFVEDIRELSAQIREENEMEMAQG